MPPRRADLPDPWCKSDPRVRKVWSPNSLGLASKCPTLYNLASVEGWRSPKAEPKPWAGSLIHDGWATLDRLSAEGAERPVAIREALRAVLVAAHAEPETLALGHLPFDDKAKPGGKAATWAEVIGRALIWYWDTMDRRGVRPAANVIPTEEPATIDLPIDSPDGDPYKLLVIFDRFAWVGDDLYVAERKTTSSSLSDYYLAMYEPNLQLGAQLFAIANIDWPEGVQRPAGLFLEIVHLAAGYVDFHRRFITQTDGQREEFLALIVELIQDAELFAKRGRWPHRWTSCAGRSVCQFRARVCSRDPVMRPRALKTDFVREERLPAPTPNEQVQ